MVSYRSGDVVGARSIFGRYLAGVRLIYELTLIAARSLLNPRGAAANRYQTTIDAPSRCVSDSAANELLTPE
jgi:hypothetical protein